jgi:hypothetical protein
MVNLSEGYGSGIWLTCRAQDIGGPLDYHWDDSQPSETTDPFGEKNGTKNEGRLPEDEIRTVDPEMGVQTIFLLAGAWKGLLKLRFSLCLKY